MTSVREFGTLMQAAGVTQIFIDVMAMRGVTTPNLFFMLFENPDNIEKMFGDMKSGLTHTPVDALGAPGIPETIKLDDITYLVGTAAVKAAHYNMNIAMEKTRAANASPGAPSGNTLTAPTAVKEVDITKVPKTLPKDYWDTRIAEYNTLQIGGPDRFFPVNFILGSEEVLARMVFEHVGSRMHTAPHLSEIVLSRTFTPSGQVNSLATRYRDADQKMYHDGDGNWVKTRTQLPEPLKKDFLYDGLEAVHWALIFCRWGTEKQVELWTKYWKDIVRDNPDKNYQIRQWWIQANWQLCTSLRHRVGFGNAVDLIIKSNGHNEALVKSMPTTRADSPKRTTDDTGLGGNNRKRRLANSPGRGRGRGKGSPTSVPRTKSSTWKDPCRYFALGTCTKGTDCQFFHAKQKNGQQQSQTMLSQGQTNIPPAPPPGGVTFWQPPQGKGQGKAGKGKGQ